MCRRPILSLLLAFILLITQVGCWSSKEVEELSIYTGLSLDKGSSLHWNRIWRRKAAVTSRKIKLRPAYKSSPKNHLEAQTNKAEEGTRAKL